MNQASLRAAYEAFKSILGLAPVSGNAAQTGAGVDRTGYTGAVVSVPFAVTGGPTGGTIAIKLQDSADNATFADFGTPIAPAVAASGLANLVQDLSGARKYIRAVVTPAPTGGASPVATVAAVMRLYGPDHLPAV